LTTFVENWRIALGALRVNWFRAVLTALGVVIGVASLVAVAAVSRGAQEEVADSIRRLGANVILVDGEFINIGGGQSATERTITPADAAEIANLPTVTGVARHQDMESLNISAGRYQMVTRLFGITSTYAGIYNQTVQRGRLISPTDVRSGRKVMVIGESVEAALFPDRNGLGKTIRVQNQEFEVIGIQSHLGQLADENLDTRVFVPLPVVLRSLLGGENTKSVGVQVRAEDEIEPTQGMIEDLLRENHLLPDHYADDFSTEDQAALVKEAQRATGTFRFLTYALGGISLLVGGIGIMNMMLVSVRERTREIGIRKSVGADPWKVQAQFLIEAVVLGVLGGVAGVLAGLVSTRMISDLAGWQTLVSPSSLLLAVSVALGVGLFFGFYPARRAARLDPITALRYE
jgi:putative ABC transport system permease protein